MKKIFLILFVLVIISIGGWLYTSFYGLPWKKSSTAKELETYVENKYDIQVNLVESSYSFKDSNYGATFELHDNPRIVFSALKLKNGEVLDYYAEALWVDEAENDVYPILKKSFPTLSIESYNMSPVYGVSFDLGEKKEIPSYKDIRTGMSLGVHFNDKWTKENEDVLVKEAYHFISMLQENGVENIEIYLYLKDKEKEEKRTETFSIHIEGKDLQNIHSEEDVRKYIEIF